MKSHTTHVKMMALAISASKRDGKDYGSYKKVKCRRFVRRWVLHMRSVAPSILLDQLEKMCAGKINDNMNDALNPRSLLLGDVEWMIANG